MSVLCIRTEMESKPQEQETSSRPESPVVWPDPKRPGNHFLSMYILGGFDIDDGNIELRSAIPVQDWSYSNNEVNEGNVVDVVDASGNVQQKCSIEKK
jgi:hypothetical protein